MTRKNPSFPDLAAPLEDEGSAIRPRDGAEGARPRQESSPELKASGPSTKRAASSPQPAKGSLDARLEQKMQLAAELLRNLPANDARVRLLYIAIMRRDETLLDGVLAELNKTPHGG